MRHREVIVEKDFWHHESVNVGFVGPEQGRGIVAHNVSYPLEIVRVVAQRFLVAQPQTDTTQLGPHIEPEAGGDRNHFPQVFARLRPHRLGRLLPLIGDVSQTSPEGPVVANTLVNIAGHFVATAN